MPLRPKRGIDRLKTCPHGGINHAEIAALGLTPHQVMDFSVCTNPFMPPPGIKETISSVAIEQYPNSEATELRHSLSQSLGIPANNILVGSGTTELIRLIVLVYFRQGDPVLLVEPTYGEYEIASRIAGARPVRCRVSEEENFVPKIADVINLIRKHHPRGIFICNPNNPTGKYHSRREIETIMDASADSLLILDEAYVAFVEKSWNPADLTTGGNIIVLRSMTKAYGIPGLRLGYAVARQEIIASLRRVCPPWNVNIIAQQVGTALLKKDEYLKQSLSQIREAKHFLTDRLRHIGFKVLPSDANYFLVKVGDAQEFRTSLLKQGIIVRDCSSFGLPEYIRIAPRTLPECERLIEVVSSIQQNNI